MPSLVGSEMCIRDRYQRRVHGESLKSRVKMVQRILAVAFAALICTSAVVNAATLRGQAQLTNEQSQIIAKLNDMKNGDFSNHLIDTITLQIKAGGATDDSISLLVQIRNTLESNRDQDQAEFNVLKTQLQDLIQTLTDKANAALNEVADANSRLNDLISTRTTLEQEIPRLDGQVTTLHKKIVKLQDDRAHDVNDYHARVGEQREVINVVQEIINTLTDRVLNGGDLELIEKQKLTDKLQNLKYSNPILALVDLTATFDRNLAVEIIQRLEALRDSLKAAVEDEEGAEEQAGLNYDALYAELNRVVDKLTQDLQQDKRDYEQILNDVTTQTNRRDNNQQIYDASNQQKDDTVLQLQSETDNFNARRSKISDEIDLIQQAQNLLVANAPNFRKFDQRTNVRPLR
eukprot:TRINITY_DN1069_c0_g1_i3.p2 TRINITY_DN1069_c0_g1~~TRINITY_DN1069_c0_g1_i3.p2  ORF type:complete len:404 (+),score=214.08 TRINITY_DN1069_c0_g1_i3:64-1275(+)